MAKPVIEAHPALVIVYNTSKFPRLLLSIYDAGYRGGKGPYPFAANVIGGNPDIKEKDNSSLEVLTREVKEEFNPDYQIDNPKTNIFKQRVLWAKPRDIKLVRDNILTNLKPFKDFYVQAKPFAEGTAEYNALFSYFFSEISEETLGIVESNLRRQKTLTTEGLVGIFSLGELENDPRGQLTTAHATAPVLNYAFGSSILHPSEIKIKALGLPRSSFQDYLTDFEYSKEQKPNHNNPSKMDPSFYEVVFGEL